jgi:hypothetical protein
LEHHFLTTHARLSTSDKTWEVNEDSLSPEQDTYFDQPGQETNNSRNQSSVCDKRSNEVPEIDSDSTFSHDLDHVDTAEVSYHVRDEIVAEGTSLKCMI